MIGLLTSTLACSGDLAGDFGPADEGVTTGDDTGTSDGGGTGGGDGDGDGESGGGDGDGDGEPDDCNLDCGPQGSCVEIDLVAYCECPEGTEWAPQGCGACPVVEDAAHDLDVQMVGFGGRFLVAGSPAPTSEYDDANLYLENARTGDRVHVGNTHDAVFSVRVTPGIYDLVYEVETPGAALPHNTRAQLRKLALFGPLEQDIDIPVATRSGNILLNDVAPPKSEYDDANILFRDESGQEVLAGSTHDGDYAINLVPGIYEIVYRVETAGDLVPRNDGAVLDTIQVFGNELLYDVTVASVQIKGDFEIGSLPAPASEYDDANIDLSSGILGTVWLGNTHDGSYDVQVIPGVYERVYRHETGSAVPRNTRATFGELDASVGGEHLVDVPVVEISGALTINGAAPPASEFDDGVLQLRGVGSEDQVLLGNTHSGSYQVKILPGAYDIYYGQETAGGTVPENKAARVGDLMVQQSASVNLDVDAVQISGSFTLGGVTPPDSEYEDGRVYLRNLSTGDAILLGSTHAGGYTAVVVPGDYEAFYGVETGGELVPANQDASLGAVQIGGPMNLDLEIPVVEIGGKTLLLGAPAPDTPSDGGQLYLRSASGDSVLLGDSYAPSWNVKLVSGTYGVYYRSEKSVTMPQNENGRFACVTIP